MQDRILGPLTMVQFVYAVIGGGLCYTIYMSLPSPLSLVLVLPIAMLTAAVIFVKVNERPFTNFLISVYQYMSAPKQKLWHHEGTSNLTVETYKAKAENTGPAVQAKNFTREQIREFAKKLDQG